MLASEQPITWVADAGKLASLCNHWRTLPMIAIDTEFLRTNTFYPIPALVQVNDGQGNYLIDPNACGDLQPLKALLADSSVQKVLHSCTEDLEVFQHLLQCLPTNLFDTQIAAAFCGFGFSVGYANLVNAALGIQLPKDETRSDWLQRPLTDAQIQYAVSDVQHLYGLAAKLQQQLHELGRYAWVLDECESLIPSFCEAQKPTNALKRIKGAWRLGLRNQVILGELAYWRELVAQQRDIPRNYVLRESALYAIAARSPDHISQLRQIDGVSESAIRRYGEAIIDIIAEASATDESDWPKQLPRPLSGEQNRQVKALRRKLTELAEQLGMAPEMLARKKDYEYMARALDRGERGAGILPPGFNHWRTELVSKYLVE